MNERLILFHFYSENMKKKKKKPKSIFMLKKLRVLDLSAGVNLVNKGHNKKEI